MTDQEIRLKFGEMNAGEMRLARALVAWHEREIANLKAALPARPQADEIVSLKDALLQAQEAAKDLLAQRDKAQAELAALRKLILADDGRSLGEVAMKASFDADTEGFTVDQCYDAAAQAVAAVVLAQAVRRMEAVTVVEVADIIRKAWLDRGGWIDPAAEAVRARLIAAAKGEGQAKEIPQAEAEPAQAWTPAVGDVVRLKSGGPMMTVNDLDEETHECECVSMSQGCIQRFLVFAACLTPVQP